MQNHNLFTVLYKCETNMTVKTTVFYDATLYSLAEIYPRFRGTLCLHMQSYFDLN
jgi:hypothetical protein